MKVYLAASWTRQSEIRAIGEWIGKMGITVTSRWLHEPTATSKDYPRERRVRLALSDLGDVRESDILIRFTDDLRSETVSSRLATGSRMFEMGVAYERGATIVVVGGYQPIFDYLPEVVHVHDLVELRSYLEGLL